MILVSGNVSRYPRGPVLRLMRANSKPERRANIVIVDVSLQVNF